jgi:uncharacterized protein
MSQMNLSRRIFMQQFIAGGLTLAATSGSSASAALLDGTLFNPCLNGLPLPLAKHPLVIAAWEGIEPARYWDAHAHIAGTGDSGSGIFTTPDMESLWHPIQYAQHKFYLNAGCTKKGQVDSSYVERLLGLVKELNSVATGFAGEKAKSPPKAKLMLFAFEQAYDETGNAQPAHTAFYVPNAYVQQVVRSAPEFFEWVCSIHPYRRDAVDALDAAVGNGARAVKWLPSAMGIDPASPRCDAFYRALARLNVPLICHAGEEKAVEGMGFHDANNPLKMRRAMDAGVRVVIAHCASIGEDIDLDKGRNGPHVRSFELFSRLMDDAHYRHFLFADISAIVMRNRSIVTLRAILEHQDWHGRLLNGSDYPLPGVLPLFTTGKLAKSGLLDHVAVPLLDEIQRYNPLLFDFVLKRQLRAGTQKFPANVFHTKDFFLRSTQ